MHFCPGTPMHLLSGVDSAALAGMERGKAFSIMLGRLQHELREVYGAENARKVLQAIMDTMG